MKQLLFFICCVILFACGDKPKGTLQGREYQGVFLGKQYSIEVIGDSTNYQAEIDPILDELSRQFSLTDSTSSLYQFNYWKKVEEPLTIQDPQHYFVRFYHLMEEMKMKSNGKFDPTAVALERVMQFAASDPEFIPNLEGFKNAVGFGPALMELKETGSQVQLIKHHPDAEWDVTDAVACWAMDLIAEQLKGHGFSAIKISLAGKYLVIGNGPSDFNQVPMGFTGQAQDPKVNIVNRGLSYKGAQDKRMFVDVATAKWIENDFQWVSVSAPSLLESEVFSKAFMCMSLDEVARWYDNNGNSDIQSSIIYGNKEKMDRATTEEFDKMIVVAPAQ
jgi:thiamine biosynthesis lipoprotein ApbE